MANGRIKIGMNLYAEPSGSKWIRLARRTEELGYDVLSLSDHVAGLVNREFVRLSPIPALAAAAAVTERIRFSMFVLCNDFRHPGVLAKDLSTLDVISNGRVELGIGAGWDASEFSELGIPFDRPAVRVARMYESVDILRALWDGRPVSYSGEYYQISDYEVFPKPVQERIPIMIGGGGPKMLTRAAAVADIISLMTFNADRKVVALGGKQVGRDAVREQISWIRDGAGDRLDKITINCRANIFCLTNDRESAARKLAPALDMDHADLLDSPYALIGNHQQMTDHIARLRDELGITYVALNQPDLEDFAPVLEMLQKI